MLIFLREGSVASYLDSHFRQGFSGRHDVPSSHLLSFSTVGKTAFSPMLTSRRVWSCIFSFRLLNTNALQMRDCSLSSRGIINMLELDLIL